MIIYPPEHPSKEKFQTTPHRGLAPPQTLPPQRGLQHSITNLAIDLDETLIEPLCGKRFKARWSSSQHCKFITLH